MSTSLIWDSSKQHNSLESLSSWHTGVSVPLRKESPTTITHHIFLVVLFVIQGEDQAALLSFNISPHVTGLSSSVCRAVEQFCKSTSGFRGSVFLLLGFATASFHSSELLATLPLCVKVWEVSAVGPPQTVLGTRCLTLSQPPWSYAAFLPPRAVQPAAAGGSFTWSHLLQTGLLPVLAPGERTRHYLQSEICTAASPFGPKAAWQNIAWHFQLNAQLYFLLWA